MSSTADDANTTPQVDGTTRSAAVTDHTQESDAVADTVTSTVDGVDKPAKAEGASPNDDATKTDAADQSSTADGPSADQMPQGASDKAEDDTAVVKAEKRDPTTEQLDRYKRRFQIWQAKVLLPLSPDLILSLIGISGHANGVLTIDLLMYPLPRLKKI